jgi:hypothetical protein
MATALAVVLRACCVIDMLATPPLPPKQVFHQAMDDWHNRTPSLASSAASMQSAKDPPRLTAG